ncbi:MAG: hypothetical protein OXN95_01345 [bacterium]|nr:hypothetical protein [bacterium]
MLLFPIGDNLQHLLSVGLPLFMVVEPIFVLLQVTRYRFFYIESRSHSSSATEAFAGWAQSACSCWSDLFWLPIGVALLGSGTSLFPEPAYPYDT